MGTVNLEVCTSMKFLIVVALAGVAVADPDAGYLYGGYAGHLVPTVSGGLVPSGGPLVPGLGVYGGYGGYAHHGYAGYAGLVPTSSGGLVPAGGPLVPGIHGYRKRSADADAGLVPTASGGLVPAGGAIVPGYGAYAGHVGAHLIPTASG